MRHKTSLVAIALIASACVRAPAPARPTPVAVSGPPAAGPTSKRDSAGAKPDTPAAVGQTGAPAPTETPRAVVSASDVTRGAVGIFGDSIVAPSGADSAAEAEEGPRWDIDVESYANTERVDHYVHMFTGSARDRIAARLSRGTRYEPMIRAKMRAGGLPEDMYYLALVESGFDPNAYSRAAAVGMWQFMASTGRDLGLRVDWWVDERRDPVRSTGAAVRFIRGLKEQFGSLYLAAAAYNGGPGRVARGLSRYADDLEGTSGDDLFFALAEKDYLRNETKEYVPQLIAAALIAKEPARYGLEIQPLPPLAYDSARVPAATPLAAVAKAAGTTVEQIRELNPQILRGMTPPRTPYFVRLPVGAGAAFDSSLHALPDEELIAYKAVSSKKGERIEDLAYRVHSSSRAIATFNPQLKRSRKTGKLVPGQTVLVPTAAVVAAATSAPDPSIEIYGGSRTSVKIHVVKSGQTLSGIAKKYGTTTKALMQLNGLRRPMIFPGQELVVKGRPAARRGTRSASAHRTESSKRVAAGKRSGKSAKATKAVASKRSGPARTAVATAAVRKPAATKSGSNKKTAAKSSAKKGAVVARKGNASAKSGGK